MGSPRRRKGRRKQRGISLVELMVALTLGLLLGAAVVQIFLSSKHAYRMQDAISRMQEGGRFAIDAIAGDTRMAGYMGCASVDQISVTIQVPPELRPADLEFDSNKIVRGENNVTAASIYAAAPYQAALDTDVLIIRKASNGGVKLTGNMATDNANIQIVDNPEDFEAGDLLFITDCVTADLFCAGTVSEASSGTITVPHPSSCNYTPKLSKAYGADAEVLVFQSIVYFIRDTGRTTPAGNPIRALWVMSRGAKSGTGALTAYELVEGVQDMQLRFGVDTNNDRTADVYRTADNVGATSWDRVVSVRVSLLMQSVEDNIVGTDGTTQVLEFNDDEIESDGRLRQVFSTVVAVRNRLP